MKNITNLYRSIVAFFVGIAIIIPGLSGGTILASTNTLEDITTSGVETITKRDKNKFINILFYLVGIAAGALLAAILIKDMIENYEWQTLTVFLIFIFGSLVWFIRENNIDYASKLSTAVFIPATFGLILLSENTGSSNEIVYVSLLAGVLAGASMLMPGLSGSMLLLVMGKYYLVTDNVANAEFFTLDFILFAIGVIIGTIFTAVTLVKLFKSHAKQVNEVSYGLILASAAVIIKQIISSV